MELSITDGDGRPLATRVDLWKLEVPADFMFSEGSQKVWEGDVDVVGVTLKDLEAGPYCVVIHAESAQLATPHYVEVSRHTAEVVLEAKLPRTFPLRLKVVDMHGEPLPRIDVRTLERRGEGNPARSAVAHRWVTPREYRWREGMCMDFCGGSIMVPPFGEPEVWEVDADGWFHFGEVTEPAIGGEYAHVTRAVAAPDHDRRGPSFSPNFNWPSKDYCMLWPGEDLKQEVLARMNAMVDKPGVHVDSIAASELTLRPVIGNGTFQPAEHGRFEINLLRRPVGRGDYGSIPTLDEDIYRILTLFDPAE